MNYEDRYATGHPHTYALTLRNSLFISFFPVQTVRAKWKDKLRNKRYIYLYSSSTVRDRVLEAVELAQKIGNVVVMI